MEMMNTTKISGVGAVADVVYPESTCWSLVLANYEVVKCIAPYLSSGAMALVIKNIMFLLESFIVGTVAFRLNVLDHTHL